MGMIVDMVAVLLILGMTYALMSEGLWGAALMFFNALFAALITMNCYEPLAQVIGTNVSFLSGYADALCILLIFTVTLLLMRLATEAMAPSMIRFPAPVFHLGRIIFGFAGSMVTMGVLLLALDASPVNKKILGSIDYKSKPMYGVRLDKEILAFFQWSTGQIFTRQGPTRDPFKEYGNARVFDPKGRWLLNAQDARPYGTDKVLEDEKPAEAAAPAEGAAAPGAPGMPTAKPGP